MIVKITESYIEKNLQCPVGKNRVEVVDSARSGLYIEVRSTSQFQGQFHGTYYLRYKDSTGKTCHQRIGSTLDTPLALARKKAKDLKAEIQLGADPRGAEKARQAVQTFTEYFENRLLPYLKQRKRSWQKDEGMFNLRLKKEFGHLRLNQITRQHVQAFHSNLKASGLAGATCDHHVKLMRYALNVAVEWEMLDQNPIARVHLFNEDNKVEHYLDDAELKRLMGVLRTDPRRGACLVAQYLLSTGARLNEALQATWDQIDRKNRVWRIPASNSKSKRIRSVPLNDSAIDILNQLDTEGEFEHIFINRKTGKRYVNIHKSWEQIRAKAGLPNLRIHDLRHQYASFLVNSGRTLYEVQQILGHSDSKVTQRYAHLSTKTLQAAAHSASIMINEAIHGSVKVVAVPALVQMELAA